MDNGYNIDQDNPLLESDSIKICRVLDNDGNRIGITTIPKIKIPKGCRIEVNGSYCPNPFEYAGTTGKWGQHEAKKKDKQ